VEAITLQDILTLARQESAWMHHYFIGVEHLFIALTQLKGGLTVAVLEHHGLAPHFLQYSIRETVGRYENQRYWPGFPETLRASDVLALAKRYAGLHAVSERDLLLAILDENDSVAIRVLHEMGTDPRTLRQTAANWTTPLRPQPPEVPIHGEVDLSPGQQRVLQVMFRDYSEIQIVRELDGGYSGARVLLVRPVRVGGFRDAPAVVKLDDRHTILYERRRYDLFVKGTLPAAAAFPLEAPVVPDDSPFGGLKYVFVGHLDEADPVSLRELAVRQDPQKIGELIHVLYEVFGPAWWLQRQPYRFGIWREYEHVLPPALVVEALPEETPGVVGHILGPLGDWSRVNKVLPGEIVALKGLVVQKADFERDILHLAAGAQPEAINRSSKVEVRGLGANPAAYFHGETVDQVIGRVVSTRDDLLLRSLQSLEPDFDLRLDRIPSGHDAVGDLPNPLRKIGELLDRQVDGYLSTVHGDLHLGNILIGPHGDPWLIDFAWTREGHTLFDWALLEASLLVEVVSQLAPAGWEGVWGIIGLLDAINRGADRAARERHQAGRALSTVNVIREIVKQCLARPGRWNEYYIPLALLSLRMMDWRSVGIQGRRLAFLLAALSISALELPSDLQTSIGGNWSDMTSADRTDLRPDNQG
jgi:hypothetical protein